MVELSVSGKEISTGSAAKMALCRRLCFSSSNLIQNLNFSTSSCLRIRKWRLEQGLEADPRTYGPLTNLPDYSFLDGRPVLLSATKISKLQYQRDICERIVTLNQEMDSTLEAYNKEQEERKKMREAILKSKLKPKGAALLSKDRKNSNTQS